MRTCDPKRGQQILDAAAQLFAMHHYHQVRMDDIADHAGVAKGTLYRYYNDKEDLYLALTVHGMQRLFDESHGKIIGPGDPCDKVRDFIRNIVRFYEQQPYFLELIQRIETSGSTASTNALHAIRTQWFQLVTELVTQLESTGKPMAERPQWAALALVGIIRGLLRFTPQPWPSDMADWIYDQFMHGMTTRVTCV